MAVTPRRRSRSLPGDLPQAAPGEVLVWTDGACRRNPGPGGWAAVVCWEDGVVEEHSGGRPHTTNKESWVQLDAESSDHERIRWHWVKGHIGHELNERADVLAVAATRLAAGPQS